MERVADQFAPTYKDFKGFKGVTFFVDEAGGMYGSLTLWETREAADAAAAELRPRLRQALSEAGLTGQPDIRLVEIYEPRG